MIPKTLLPAVPSQENYAPSMPIEYILWICPSDPPSCGISDPAPTVLSIKAQKNLITYRCLTYCLCTMHPDHRSAEQQRTLNSIHHIIKSTESQLKDLEETLASQDRAFPLVLQDANRIIEQFTLMHKLAEDKIRQGERRGYLTRQQVDELHRELNAAVARMAEVSRYSEVLTQILREKFGADVVG